MTLEGVDTRKDGALKFSGKVENTPREPDAVKWIDNDRIVIANEGDWKGGSRGFTIFSKTGEVVYESGASFNMPLQISATIPSIATRGRRAGRRRGRRLWRPEAPLHRLGTRFAGRHLRGHGRRAEAACRCCRQASAPEGLLAIPSRNLFVTANETDLVEDGLARSHVMVFERTEGPAAYPMLVANRTRSGKPLGWGALGALTADRSEAGKLFAASDSVYSSAPSIFTIDTTRKPAVITVKTIVTRGGNPAQKLDIEGLAVDGEGGFWLASEGDPAKLVPNAIYRVDEKGEIRQEIALPAELYGKETRFGFEGITTIGEGDDLTLILAVQREWQDDPKGQVNFLAYKPKVKEWSAVRYPLDSAETGWIGLSEIAASGDGLYIDVTTRSAPTPGPRTSIAWRLTPSGRPSSTVIYLPLVEKTLVRDLIPDLKGATNGYVVDKVEGFAIDAAGDAFVVTDNDGVDDSSGETIFLNLGNIAASN